MSVQLDSFRRYVASQPAPPRQEPAGCVLLVGSGKGGVGTSTVAALLAIMAASDGHEVLLVDADESHGALPLLLGAAPHHPLAALRGGLVEPTDLLVSLGQGLVLLPAGGTDRPQDRLATVERRALLRRTESLHPRFDLVVIDAGSRLEQVLAAAAAGVTRFLAVTAPERVSAAATYALVKTLDNDLGGLPIDLLVNRCIPAAAKQAFDEMEAATRHFLRRSLGFAGAVPDDDRIRAAMAAGDPLQEAAALGSAATTACHEVAARLVRHLHERSLAVVPPRLSTRR